MSHSTNETQKRRRQLILTLVCGAIVAAVVLGAFAKTVFYGDAISRVYQLGQRDTLFSKFFIAEREGYDASVYQYFVPSHFFLVEQLRQGVIPLWNPLVGCGAPFLADVETAVFWPLRIMLLLVPPLRSWNLLIVANVLNFGIGTFILGTALKLRRCSIVLASLICAFCPYLIFQSELIGSSASMIPLVMASFIYAQADSKVLRKALTGLACAVMIVSGHPEPSFFGIACASMLYLLLCLFDKSTDRSLIKKLAFSLGDIAVIGAFAFCFSSFMLLPLFELLKNSTCYKLGLTGHRDGVPLNSILINLVHPAYGNSSPYLGAMAVPLILSGVWFGFANDRYIKAFSIASLIFLAVMSQIGPLDWLMNSPAFAWFVPKYCWPALLIMLSILAACGLEQIIDNLQKNFRAALIVIAVACAIVLASLIAVHAAPGLLVAIRQDEAFDHMRLISKVFTRDIILLIAFCLLFAASRFLRKGQALACCILIGVASGISLGPMVKLASPSGRKFNYDAVEPIPFLEQHKDRVVSMGRHVFCPSSNFCYGINNFVPVNVYHPLRFQNYLVESGVTPEGVNQFFDGRLTHFADLAAVKYVVTPQPVLGQNETTAEPKALKSGREVIWDAPGDKTSGVVSSSNSGVSDGAHHGVGSGANSTNNIGSTSGASVPTDTGGQQKLKLVGGGLSFYPSNRELMGSLRFQASADVARDLGIQGILFDEKKNVLWLGDIDRILYQFSKVPKDKTILNLTHDVCVPLPNVSGRLTLVVQVFDWAQMKYLPIRLSANAATDSKQMNGVTNAEQINGAKVGKHIAGDAGGKHMPGERDSKQMPGATVGNSATSESKQAKLPEDEASRLAIASCDVSHGSISSELIANCSVENADRRFKLREETASHVRVYENMRALPNAYLCRDYLISQNESGALAAEKNKSFDPNKQVVLEIASSTDPASGAKILNELKAIKNASLTASEPVQFHRINCNKISVEVESAAPALLVLAETNYPGWKASIAHDAHSSETTIMRANDLFQAVLLPVGKSVVTFEFRPLGFVIGIVLVLLAAVTTLALTFQSMRRAREQDK